MKLLVINPGSTSTKISLFEDENKLFEESPFHDAPLLLQYPNVNDQVPFRKQIILDMLKRHGYKPEEIDVYIGRGGSAWSQPSGVTEISETLYRDTVTASAAANIPQNWASCSPGSWAERSAGKCTP